MHGKVISISVYGFMTFALSSGAILWGSEARAECPLGTYYSDGSCVRNTSPHRDLRKSTINKIRPIRKKPRRK
jgi:hypothetical protein